MRAKEPKMPKNEVRYYAVKKAEVRKAGTVQKEVLVINLDGLSFGSAGREGKLSNPEAGILAHVGVSKKCQYVFFWDGELYVRYMSHELSGKASSYDRRAEARLACSVGEQKRREYSFVHYPDSYAAQLYDPTKLPTRIGGSVHLWSGNVSWGSGKGKIALKPFDGEFRHDWRS
jgi:hypothetical protein